MAHLDITKNKDGTVTVRSGSYREHISTEGKSLMQVLDEVRWAAITASVPLDEDRVWEMLREDQR